MGSASVAGTVAGTVAVPCMGWEPDVASAAVGAVGPALARRGWSWPWNLSG